MCRLTKIVATLGPASEERLQEMILAGVNVFRLNFSHTRGDYSQHIKNIANIRETSARLGIPVAILGDLQGPKFRVGELENHQAVTLVPGAKLRFSVGKNIGTAEHIYTKNAAVIHGLSVGHKVLLDDGCLELKVVERVSLDEIVCEVVVGGKLGEKKGINVPDILVDSRLSEKDKDDALFAIGQNLDFLAMSFVQKPEDVTELREFCVAHAEKSSAADHHHWKRSVLSRLLLSSKDTHKAWGDTLPLIIAKIEKPQAVANIKVILDCADGLMVARGDLGVEMSLERVPAVQKMLIEMCNEAKKPVITATQMLQSMIENPIPTRAEVSDVANAVFDGTDAVMLSAESAVGAYPVQAVATQARIIKDAEDAMRSDFHQARLRKIPVPEDSLEDAPYYHTIARAAVSASRKAKVTAIIAISNSGEMASRIAKHKPLKPVFALTPEEHAYRRMALCGGVHPILVPRSSTAEDTLFTMERALREKRFLQDGETVVFCAATTTVPTLSNSLKLYKFGDFTPQTD